MPPRMLKRVRKLKSGKVWIGYYYNGRDEEEIERRFRWVAT